MLRHPRRLPRGQTDDPRGLRAPGSRVLPNVLGPPRAAQPTEILRVGRPTSTRQLVADGSRASYHCAQGDRYVAGMSARTAARDERIRTLRGEGHTLEHIANEVGLTRERVRQVLLRVGGPTAADVRAAAEARGRAAAARLEQLIREDIVAHPASTIEDVAARLGQDKSEVQAHLPKDLRPRVVRLGRSSEGAWSADEVVQAVAAAATYAYPLSAGDYERLLHAGEFRGPSAARISQMYGNWSAACRQAGVEPPPPRRRSYQSRWTGADLLGFVRDYLRAPGCRGTFDGYDLWRREAGIEAPSAALLRNRLGTWSDMKRKALDS